MENDSSRSPRSLTNQARTVRNVGKLRGDDGFDLLLRQLSLRLRHKLDEERGAPDFELAGRARAAEHEHLARLQECPQRLDHLVGLAAGSSSFVPGGSSTETTARDVSSSGRKPDGSSVVA